MTTTPTKNESLPELVARWRAEGHRLNGGADKPYTDDENSVLALAMEHCASELEAALTREALTEGVGGKNVKHAMMSAWAMLPDSVRGHPARMEWLGRKFLELTATQPPHQDRGGVEAACAAFARLDGIDWNDAEWQRTHAIEAGRLRTRITAALTEAKQPATMDGMPSLEEMRPHIRRWVREANEEAKQQGPVEAQS